MNPQNWSVFLVAGCVGSASVSRLRCFPLLSGSCVCSLLSVGCGVPPSVSGLLCGRLRLVCSLLLVGRGVFGCRAGVLVCWLAVVCSLLSLGCAVVGCVGFFSVGLLCRVPSVGLLRVFLSARCVCPFCRPVALSVGPATLSVPVGASPLFYPCFPGRRGVCKGGKRCEASGVRGREVASWEFLSQQKPSPQTPPQGATLCDGTYLGSARKQAEPSR